MNNCKEPGFAGDICLGLSTCFREGQLDTLDDPENNDRLRGLNDFINAAENGHMKGCLCVKRLLEKAIEKRKSLNNPQQSLHFLQRLFVFWNLKMSSSWSQF